MVGTTPGNDAVDWGASAREAWQMLEPVHACVYYSPEMASGFTSAGLDSWSGYFACRAAPLGAISAEMVTAAFFNFSPDMVRACVPEVWSKITPTAAWHLRVDAAGETLWRILGDRRTAALIDEAGELAVAAMMGADVAGRVFAAAHRDLEVPGSAVERLWFGSTFLREFRGEGHIAALVAAGISGLEAHVLQAAFGRISQETVVTRRGWSRSEWSASAVGLQERGLLDSNGALTSDGEELKRDIELRTDAAASSPYRSLGLSATARLIELSRVLGATVTECDAIPTTNALGLPTSR